MANGRSCYLITILMAMIELLLALAASVSLTGAMEGGGGGGERS